MSAERVIETAWGELGYTESPAGSNRTKYGAAYGLDGYPWCVMFLWWCFREAGESSAFLGGGKTASCGTLLRWYMEKGLRYSASHVQPGDIVILNFHGTQDTEHCGLVIGVKRNYPEDQEPYVTTIEGNTVPGLEGSQDNGGCVALKYRYAHQIVGVCRQAYTETEDEGRETPSSGAAAPPSPQGEGRDYVGHWAEKDIRWCMERGLMTGYPDGSFQPDKPVTRAEAATILRRFYNLVGDDGK